MAIARTAEQRAWAESVRAGGVDELSTVALPGELGGAGGTPLDVAVGFEAAAGSEALPAGPLFGTVLAALVLARQPDSAVAKELGPALADGAAAAVAFAPGSVVATETERGISVRGRTEPVLGADSSTHLLLAADLDGSTVWFALPPRGTTVETGLDLARGASVFELAEEVPRSAILGDAPVVPLALTLAAAEASGIARWSVRTAAEYAKVREQFGTPIGSFQAVKHLCATMLCRAEAASVLAWDAARADGVHELASAVAGARALDAAVENAKDCIQVLGGIGFTWEHDAHRYLRRAVVLRQLLGGAGRWRRRAAELALAGQRRKISVDVGADAEVRAVAEEVAALPLDEQRVRLADTGFLMPHWPRPYGLAAEPARQLVIDAELDRAGVHRPDLVIGAWAVPTILEHGTPEQIDRFARPTLRGEIVWCQLFSEPEAGSDLASLRTKATEVDGGWRLSGQKVWSSLAHKADWAICLARTDPEAPKHKGITYFLVDMRASGIEVRPLKQITGDEDFNEVFLDDVFVPDELVVGEVNGGWRLARTTLANERVAMGSGSSVGEAVENLLKGVRSPDPVVLDRIGALVADGTACSLLDLSATMARLAGQDPGAESSVRKLLGVRHRQSVAELALELRGPLGVFESEESHEFLLTRCLSIAGGTEQILLNLAAERLLGLPR